MKKLKMLSSLLLIIGLPILLSAQEDQIGKNSEGFESIFNGEKSGNYVGTVNGVLIVKKNGLTEELILDFQGSAAKLAIIADEHEVYDISTKSYQGQTTSGRTQLTYSTYATANSIGIYLDHQWFELSLIDGGCDMAINGLEYVYKTEKTAEYLILRVSKEIVLTNSQYLYQHFEGENIEAHKKSIILLPESTIVFAIKR